MSAIMRVLENQPEAPHPLLAMQTLALKNVTVVIGDRVFIRLPGISDDPNRIRWTVEQKREVAEGLRSSLLNGYEWLRQPHGPKTQTGPF